MVTVKCNKPEHQEPLPLYGCAHCLQERIAELERKLGQAEVRLIEAEGDKQAIAIREAKAILEVKRLQRIAEAAQAACKTAVIALTSNYAMIGKDEFHNLNESLKALQQDEGVQIDPQAEDGAPGAAGGRTDGK